MAVSLTKAYREREIEVPRYPRTGRPMSEMTFAGNNCQSGTNYLPVVRYESLYYSAMQPTKEYCGTFYYYEPDSTNFLNLGNCLITGNKIGAAIELLNQSENQDRRSKAIKEEIEEKIQEILVNSVKSLPYVHGIINRTKDVEEGLEYLNNLLAKMKQLATETIPSETNISDKDYLVEFRVNKDTSFIINQVFESLGLIKGKWRGLEKGTYHGNMFFARSDSLDQYLCSRAQELGYDTILLQREPGETRAVTEILDVRPRQVSYQNICKERFNLPTHTTNYPTIWFPEYGFMTYTKTP